MEREQQEEQKRAERRQQERSKIQVFTQLLTGFAMEQPGCVGRGTRVAAGEPPPAERGHGEHLRASEAVRERAAGRGGFLRKN